MRSIHLDPKVTRLRRSALRALSVAGAALLASSALPTASRAADVRGSLQGIDSVQPTPTPDVPNRRLFYWQEPNGAIDVRRPRPNPEMDLPVVVSGGNITESTQPARAEVVGGRCRPGTIVVSPGTTIHLDNNDWFPHRFYIAPADEPDAPPPAEDATHPVTAPRAPFETQIAQPGTYILHDALSPLFRCYVAVAAGQQGRAVMPGPDGSFRTTGLADGDYTVHVWFEGRSLADTTAHVANGHDVTVPAINLAAPAAGAAGGAAAGGAPAAGGAAPAAGADDGGGGGGGGHHHHHGGR